MSDKTKVPEKVVAKSSAISTTTRKTIAKAGMAASLGTLVATGLLETRRSDTLKKLHLWSGFALLGFSYWHYSLYQSPTRSGKKG